MRFKTINGQTVANVDLDDTMLDWTGKLVRKIEKKYPQIEIIERKSHTIWNYSSNYPEKYRERIDEIWHQPGFYRDLELIPGAKEGYKFLIENNCIVHFVSTPIVGINRGICMLEKFECLKNTLGLKAAELLIPTGDKTLIRADFLIDDNPVIVGLYNHPTTHLTFDRIDCEFNKNIPDDSKINWENFPERFNHLVSKHNSILSM